MSNPLIDLGPLPAFSAITPEHIEPAIDAILAENRQHIDEIVASREPRRWATVAEPMAEMSNRLARAWSPVSHLNSVMNNDALRGAYVACLEKLSAYRSEIHQHEGLFDAYRAVAEGDEPLTDAQRQVLSNVLRDFHLAGVDLPEEERSRYRDISRELSSLGSSFENNLLDATHAWSKRIDDVEALAGLPMSALDLARQTAQERGESGYVLTLEFPSYFPVLTYADDESLREELYTAYQTRASDQGPHAGRFDNTAVMWRILALRHEQAQLLGFSNFAELSLARKMARTTDEVMNFLGELVERSHTQALREFEELQVYAAREHGKTSLAPWDVPYYSEKYRQQRHGISEEEVKAYFPADRVIEGMFAVVGRLFDISFHPLTEVDVYHPDIRFYEIRDREGRTRAQFYFDLYARPKKRGGAWMDDCQSRLRTSTLDQLPVAYMTCNFTPPVGGKPSLLTHREVETLFHEFGHGLHHMLTRVEHLEIAGINGVAWDAVELPSQFMENFCWEREALDLFAAHCETGEKIPDALFQRMTAARNFQSGMQMVRQLELALFDFRLHLEYDAGRADFIGDVLDEVRDRVAVLKPPTWTRFPQAFSHIFEGSYAAGYYSYKWAEVLSADAYSRFEEEGVFDPRPGRAFLEHILERGGSDDAMNLFRAFRGREPTIDALLRHTGIAA